MRPFRSLIGITSLIIVFLTPTIYIHLNPVNWKARLDDSGTLLSMVSSSEFIVRGMSTPVSSNPRVAVCIIGDMDPFLRRSLRNSIHKYIILPLRSVGVEVHVFFRITGGEELPSRNTPTRRFRAMKRAMREFDPVRVSYYSSFQMNAYQPTSPCPRQRHPLGQIQLAPQPAEQCLDLIAKHEGAVRWKYDWIYKTQTDVAFGANISTPHELQHDTLYTNQYVDDSSPKAHDWLRSRLAADASNLMQPTGDHVWVASRDVAEVAFRAKDAFHACQMHDPRRTLLTRATGIRHWLVRNKIKFAALPWFWMLVKTEEGPQCELLQGIGAPNRTEYKLRVDSCMHYKRTGVISQLRFFEK